MNAATARTRGRILRTAEKLFARHGVDQVSMRQINLASGQRNSSATQYHFGNKDALIEALFDYRMEPINERRLEMLAELEQAGEEPDLRDLVEVLVHPLVDHLRVEGESCYYIPLVGQVAGHPRYYAIARTRDRHGTGLQQLLKMIRANLADIPEQLILERFGMALRQVFNELADYQRLHLSGSRASKSATSLFVCGLVDAVTAQFAAPVSEATQQELDRPRRQSA